MASPAESPDAAAKSERMRLLQSFHLTDAGNAAGLELLYGNELRYDYSVGRWRVWNGRYWPLDDKGRADRAALDTARQRLSAAVLISEPDKAKKAIEWALRSESVYGRKATLLSAQSTETFATVGEGYDRAPFLFTTGNGTLNLITGDLGPFRPKDLITRATVVEYVPNARCPRWLSFLDEVFGGDRALIDFVRRAVGYSLTGDTSEQCIFILYGDGANGKTTFLETILQLVGTHAAVTPFASFLVQANPGGPRNDIALLRGSRLVKASESQKEGKLDEAVIKEVTGGDMISARRLYCEFETFKPTFKLWLATNHRPSIRGTDHAIWRRIHLIPFKRQFSGRNRDPKLFETLQGELSGILTWAVQGCLEWQQTGLGTSPIVETATQEYRRESDQLGRFLNERCVSDANEQTSGNELYQAYIDWCAANRSKPEANNTFANGLAERSINKKRGRKGTIYLGIGLVPQATRAKLADGK